MQSQTPEVRTIDLPTAALAWLPHCGDLQVRRIAERAFDPGVRQVAREELRARGAEPLVAADRLVVATC
jgi:hypothetical protein